MTEITEELIRIKAREAIIHLVENCEFLDLVEDTDLDARFGDLTPDEAEATAQRVGEAIDTATVTVTWPDRLPGVEPDLHALLDILETGAHDGPALVAVLRSIDGGPDFPEVIDAAECPTFVDRLLEWKNNAVAAASEGANVLGAEATRESDPERARFIADARTMLDRLETNPELPLPWRFRSQYTATGTEAEQRAEIDRIAAVLDVTPETRADGGHYAAEVHIGRSSYLALAVTDAHMKRFHEESRLGTEAYERLHGSAAVKDEAARVGGEHAVTEIPEANTAEVTA